MACNRDGICIEFIKFVIVRNKNKEVEILKGEIKDDVNKV